MSENVTTNKQKIMEDEIDLRELFLTIWKKRWFIVVFTIIVTIVSIIYVSFKNPIPVYQGNITLEIGEIQSENFGSRLLDNSNNLSVILNKKFNLSTNTPKRTNNLITIVSKNKDKEKIKQKLQDSITYITNRHKEKAKFYKNYIMTKKIGNMFISNKPINKLKKKVIVSVAFVTGFILSIFLVFLMKFIKGFKKNKNNL